MLLKKYIHEFGLNSNCIINGLILGKIQCIDNLCLESTNEMIKSFILKTKQLSENQLFVTSQSAVTFGLVATAAARCLF